MSSIALPINITPVPHHITHQSSVDVSATLMESGTPWDKFVNSGDNLKIHKTLSNAEAKRVAEAIEILEGVQTETRRKNYKRFLYDVRRTLGLQGVLLGAVTFGQTKIGDMKKKDRIALLHKIEANKDNINVNHPDLDALAVKYKIPNETDLSRLPPPIADKQTQKRKRDVTESQGEAGTPESRTGDVYELTFEDVKTVTMPDQIRGRIWLMDTYDANTTPFITVPISWKLRDEFISKRQRMP